MVKNRNARGVVAAGAIMTIGAGVADAAVVQPIEHRRPPVERSVAAAGSTGATALAACLESGFSRLSRRPLCSPVDTEMSSYSVSLVPVENLTDAQTTPNIEIRHDAQTAKLDALAAVVEARAQRQAAASRAAGRQAVARTARPVDSSLLASAEAWAAEPKTKAVRQCESGDDPRMEVNNGGTEYYGLYSDNLQFWITYGGQQYASTPNLASRQEQDIVNYQGFEARGWEPWQCATEVD